MKKVILSYLCLLLSPSLFAQLYIDNTIVSIENAGVLHINDNVILEGLTAQFQNQGLIRLSGNWNNNSATQQFVNTDEGSVVFFGASPKTLDGTGTLLFNNLTVETGSGNVQLNQAITVGGSTSPTGSLILQDGTRLSLNTHKLIINNPQANALQVIGSAGIRKQANSSFTDAQVEWKGLGNNTGTYVIPFITSSGQKVGLHLQINSAGAGTSGETVFATFGTDNTNTNIPVGTNGHPYTDPLKTMDRYWSISHNGYTTNPTYSLTLQYADDEFGGTNTMDESLMTLFTWTGSTWQDIINSTIDEANNTGTHHNGTEGIYTFGSETTPLPITLLKFEATAGQNDILLNWRTTGEIHFQGFELERSTDLQHFNKIAYLPSTSTSAEEQNLYEYIDKEISVNQVYYYRLKQINTDGSFTYSNIRSAEIRAENQLLSLYPNPTYNGRINLDINMSAEDKLTFELRSIQGHLLEKGTSPLHKGSNSIKFDFSSLSNATYILILNIEKQRRRIIKKVIIEK